MRRPQITWNGLIYYGEIFGFLLAWVGGALLVAQQAGPQEEGPAWDQIASVEIASPNPVALPHSR